MKSKPDHSLLEEIKQTRPFATPAQEATVALLKTTDVIRRRLGRVLDNEGITLQQYNVLRILRGAQGQPLCALEIRDRLIEETPGVSRLIDRLVAKGLVRRDRSLDDRRLLECYITGKGLEVLARLDDSVSTADASVLKSLKPAEVTTLLNLLARIREDNR